MVGEGVVEFWGWQEDMPSVFAQAQIVCLPSYHEGFPKSLLEAAASGCAIVATDIPGCREIVRHSSGDEVAWWERRAIDPVATSRMLWVSTRRIE
jgi:glycosyltransferase involved in cell wall biosynthesis